MCELLESVFINHRCCPGRAVLPVAANDPASAVNGRSVGKIERPSGNFNKELHVLAHVQRLAELKEDAAGRNIFGDGFGVFAIGHDGDREAEWIADGTARWTVFRRLRC